jgi:hypothetical protein
MLGSEGGKFVLRNQEVTRTTKFLKNQKMELKFGGSNSLPFCQRSPNASHCTKCFLILLLKSKTSANWRTDQRQQGGN